MSWIVEAVSGVFWPQPAAVERKELSSLFYGNQDLHSAVENAPFVLELAAKPDATKYLLYLHRLYAGLSVAESAWGQAIFAGKIDLSLFFRSSRLKHDIEVFCSHHPDIAVPRMDAHVAYFQSLAQTNPQLLLVHLGLRYYAILHGGQTRLERLRQTWGEQYSFCLYEFDEKSMLAKLSRVINEYGATLSNHDFGLFEQEIKQAWVFAGDVLEHDVRHLIR
jgi:hypothetical protein